MRFDIRMQGDTADRVLRALTTFAPIFVPAALRDAVSDAAWLEAMLEVERALANAESQRRRRSRRRPRRRSPRPAAPSVYDLDGARRGRARAAGNPVEPLVRALRERVGGDAARYVHFGATSQDIVDTAAMLVARERARADRRRSSTASARACARARARASRDADGRRARCCSRPCRRRSG